MGVGSGAGETFCLGGPDWASCLPDKTIEKMKVEIYRVHDDCWRLVADDWSICILDDLPAFFEPLDFKNRDGTSTQWKLLFFEGARKCDAFEYFGELYKVCDDLY